MPLRLYKMKILSKPQPKHPRHHKIWNSLYFYISMDFPIYLPYHKSLLWPVKLWSWWRLQNIQILVILTSVIIQILVILMFLDSQILVILTFLESSILVIDVFSQPNSGHVDVSRQPTITRISASEADLKLKKASAEFFTPFALLRGSISLIYQFFSDHGRVPLMLLFLVMLQ